MTSFIYHIELVVFYVQNVWFLFAGELDVLLPEFFHLLRDTRVIPNVQHLQRLRSFQPKNDVNKYLLVKATVFKIQMLDLIVVTDKVGETPA